MEYLSLTAPQQNIWKLQKYYGDTAVSIESKRITKTIPDVLENKINQYCEYRNVTPAVVFEIAIIIYLAQINRENKSVTIGIPVLNPGNHKEKQIAEMFVSTMPLTVVLNDDMTVKHLVETITKAYIDNRDVQSTHTISIDYQTGLFCEEEVDYMIVRFEHIIEQITQNDGLKVKDICIVTQQELDAVINNFNDTYVDYLREKCIHGLFMEQAWKTPDRTALIFENRSFNYR